MTNRIVKTIQRKWTQFSTEIEAPPETSQLDWPIFAVLILLPTMLTSRYYFELSRPPSGGIFSYLGDILELPAGWVDLLSSGLLPLASLFILPILLLLLLGVTLSEMGLSLPGLQRYRLLTYFLLLIHAVILFIELFPLFSTGDSHAWFSDISSPGAGFWLTQFISKGCLASFLFGITLFPLYRRFGLHALTIISVPFCMVHFTGPPGLALLSIPMGLGLGYLSLRSQSVTCTVLIYSLLGTLLNALNLYL